MKRMMDLLSEALYSEIKQRLPHPPTTEQDIKYVLSDALAEFITVRQPVSEYIERRYPHTDKEETAEAHEERCKRKATNLRHRIVIAVVLKRRLEMIMDNNLKDVLTRAQCLVEETTVHEDTCYAIELGGKEKCRHCEAEAVLEEITEQLELLEPQKPTEECAECQCDDCINEDCLTHCMAELCTEGAVTECHRYQSRDV